MTKVTQNGSSWDKILKGPNEQLIQVSWEKHLRAAAHSHVKELWQIMQNLSRSNVFRGQQWENHEQLTSTLTRTE